MGMRKLFLLISLVLMSCEKYPTIEDGDLIQKCVIIKVKVRKPFSTIDWATRYVYTTDCGTKHVTTKPAYKVGDTLTFVYKQKKK